MNHELLKRTDIASGELCPESTQDEVCQAIQFRDALKEATRVLSERVEAGVIAWIEKNGEFAIGETRYYVGPNKSTKCKDLPATLKAVLVATEGDVEAVCRALSSSAFKHGACRELLPADEYDTLFETREVADLKTGVAKGPRLQEFNDRWKK